MRFKLVTVAILLAVTSRGHGRPSNPDPLDSSSKEATIPTNGAADKRDNLDSRHESLRELKDIQSMDQSLRTVATQLLNSTKHEDLIRVPEEKIVTIETPMQVVHISTKMEDATSIASDNDDENNTTKMKFGIPINSKFGHFELTNPGHAMVMTDEEIEKEMATATNPDLKQLPTTPSLLSTWIQLYPLSSTTEGNDASFIKNNIHTNQISSTTSTKVPLSITKQTTVNTKPIRKTESKPMTTVSIEKSTEAPLSTKSVKNITNTTNYVKISTTVSTMSIENDIEGVEISEKKNNHPTPLISSTTKPSTKKSQTKNTSTPKVKVSASKNGTTKPPKSSNTSNRVKSSSTKRPAFNKNDNVTSTSKIEKVTIKPLSNASQNHTESTEKPMFITKIKASLLTDKQKSTTSAPSTKTTYNLLSKSNFSNSDSSNMKIPNPTRVNNILKVHSKKPVDDTTKIEIQPIRVNPPVLTIEKIGDTSSDQKTDLDDQDILKNSKIDVKFDFNSEVSKVEVQTIPPDNSNLSSITTSTTKRPRSSNKRKKNKNRRRKTSTTSTTTATTDISSNDENQTSNDGINIDDLQLTGIQESKIEPESKAPPSKKKKPNQQTQIQKPISTQIYNFISREVMPSVGVMSLVGLGLGLASYFLYPFGGVIARRNYDVEPNYKYNIDEYGGNYGLSEEEVLSKVYSGMTTGQHSETKLHSNEKNPNYYRYSGSEQSKKQTPTRYPGLSNKVHGNRVVYRPVETTVYDANYRKNEFKYSDISTTPNHYERQRQHQPTDFVVALGKAAAIGNNRQFVVGNVPKEYSSDDTDRIPEIVTLQDKVDHKMQYQADENYANDNSPSLSLASLTKESERNAAALISSADEEQSVGDFDDVKINPNSQMIEHGPRSLRFDENSKMIRKKRSILPDLAGSFIPMIQRLKTPRIERSSVIQVIPSKSEIEKEKKEIEEEEDLSNEIIDIIDEALPGKGNQKKRHDGKDSTTAATKNSKMTTTTTTMKSTSKSSSTSTSSTTKENAKQVSSTTTTTTTESASTEPDFVDQGETTLDWHENVSSTTARTPAASGGIDILGIAKRIAEIKLRLGLTILKHAGEGFARYISHIQKRFNGEE